MPHFMSPLRAAQRLPSARRVLVVGCSGVGKTTLALRIADRFRLEYQSLDRDVIWLSGWRLRDKAGQRRITEHLAKRESWVMDGASPRASSRGSMRMDPPSR